MGNKDFHSRVLACIVSIVVTGCASGVAAPAAEHAFAVQGDPNGLSPKAAATDLHSGMAAEVSSEAARMQNAVERGLGAECDPKWITDVPLGDSACFGLLPAHMARFLTGIPHNYYLTLELRERHAQQPQRFKAIPGLGARADFLAVIGAPHQFWIRSFEGPDQKSTVYLVSAPRCNVASAHDPGGCFDAGHGQTLSAYRVEGEGAPENVTPEVLPLHPKLTAAEARLYGTYLSHAGAANASDLTLDISKLQYAPTMHWILQFDLDRAASTPDPRRYDDLPVAHFGFLAWNGRKFELLQQVPRSAWPCRPVLAALEPCSQDYASKGKDPFVID